MNCKKCNRQFKTGEMFYMNSGISPLCYPCAEQGQLTGVVCLIGCFLIAGGMAFGAIKLMEYLGKLFA